MKKARAAFKKCIDFFIDFSPKIDDKSSSEVRKTLFARKIDKITLPGTPFLAKDRFLVDFWVPEGTPELPKVGATFWGQWSWKPSGSHFGRFSALFGILVPFLIDSGSILITKQKRRNKSGCLVHLYKKVSKTLLAGYLPATYRLLTGYLLATCRLLGGIRVMCIATQKLFAKR